MEITWKTPVKQAKTKHQLRMTLRSLKAHVRRTKKAIDWYGDTEGQVPVSEFRDLRFAQNDVEAMEARIAAMD